MADRFDDLIGECEPGGFFDKLTPYNEVQIADIIEKHHNIPYDYVTFLREIGRGELGDNYYVIYGGLVGVTELLGTDFEGCAPELLLFGDDMQGYYNGFNTGDSWSVVEFSLIDKSLVKVADTFGQFIRDWVKLNHEVS